MKSLRIIRPTELKELLGLSHATIWRMEQRGELPNRIKLTESGRSVGWRATDIEDWLEVREQSSKA